VIRISLGRFNNEDEVSHASSAMPRLLEEVRRKRKL